MEEHDIGEDLVFSAYQSALYLKRFPCTTIITKEQSNSVKGKRLIKPKYRITEMLCTSSRGEKSPMEYVGN